MTDCILIGVLILIVVGILIYLRREKKKGVTCVGCPHGKNCSGKCGQK